MGHHSRHSERFIFNNCAASTTHVMILATDILEDICAGRHTLPSTHIASLPLADKRLITQEILGLTGFPLMESAAAAGHPLPVPSALHQAFARSIVSAAYLADATARGEFVHKNPHGVKKDGEWIISTTAKYALREAETYELYRTGCTQSLSEKVTDTRDIVIEFDTSDEPATICCHPAPV